MLEGGTYRGILGGFGLAALERHSVTLVLETLRGDETLDAGGLGVGFLAFALGLDFAADDEFADLVRFRSKGSVMGIEDGLVHRLGKNRSGVEGNSTRMDISSESDENNENRSTHIVILAQPKELANLSRPLGPQPLRQHLIRQSLDLLLALLDDAQRQHRQIHRHDATPHALALALPRPPGPVAAVARAQEEADPRGVHDALLHGEPLLVVAAGDFEDVAFVLGGEAVAGDFLAHALVHEGAEFAVVFDFDEFLGAVGRVGDVELHLDG